MAEMAAIAAGHPGAMQGSGSRHRVPAGDDSSPAMTTRSTSSMASMAQRELQLKIPKPLGRRKAMHAFDRDVAIAIAPRCWEGEVRKKFARESPIRCPYILPQRWRGTDTQAGEMGQNYSTTRPQQGRTGWRVWMGELSRKSKSRFANVPKPFCVCRSAKLRAWRALSVEALRPVSSQHRRLARGLIRGRRQPGTLSRRSTAPPRSTEYFVRCQLFC